MRKHYEYDGILTGYVWNLMQKLSFLLNIEMSLISLTMSADKYEFGFPRELTQGELDDIDVILALPDPCGPPTQQGTRLKILDLWSSRGHFENIIGVHPTYWFEKGDIDSTVPCYFYLDFDGNLDNQQKKTIMDAYKNLIIEVNP